MKKLVIILFVWAGVFSLQSQTLDYEVLGFVDENNQVISAIDLSWNQDFIPRVRIKNHGPNVPAETDTLYVDLYTNGVYQVSIRLSGNNLQPYTSGSSFTVSGGVMYSASTMEAYNMGNFNVAAVIRLEGITVDSDAENNEAELWITRPLAIEESEESYSCIYPNPACLNVTIAQAKGSQVAIFDMAGRKVFSSICQQETEVFSLDQLTTGLYLVHIFDGKNRRIEKLQVIK